MKHCAGSLVPRLSPRANEKSKKIKRGEPGRIYHVSNVIGREDLIARGRAKAQHAARPLVLQALSREDGAFCRAMCTFSKPSVVKF